MPNHKDKSAGDDLSRLADRAREGDREAFETLVARYEAGLTRIMLRRTGGRSEPAEELVHQTWITVWRSLSSGGYDPKKAAISTFIYAVANKLWLRQLRALGRTPTVGIDLDFSAIEDPSDIEADPADAVIAGEKLEAIRDCLSSEGRSNSLTPVERSIIEGLASGKTERVLAKELSLAPSTVHARKQLAYNKLRKCMEAKGY